MTTEVSICNMALSWLGQGPITSISDTGDNRSILCGANYAHLRDATLERGNWTFAMQYVNIGAYDPSRDKPNGDHSFPIPVTPHCLRVHRVFRAGEDEEYGTKVRWTRMGGYIITPETDVDIKYIARIEDPDLFSFTFVEALAAHIAAYLAIPLTENKELRDDMWNLYEYKIKEALFSDGRQGSNEVYRSNQLTGVRRL